MTVRGRYLFNPYLRMVTQPLSPQIRIFVIGGKMGKKLTWESIIKDCEIKYKNFYWYVESEQRVYEGQNTKMIGHCPDHGTFDIRVRKHKNEGQICQQCSNKKLGDISRLSWSEIILACIKKHDGFYTYYIEEQAVYENVHKTKMIIHCPKHDSFYMTVNGHKNIGSGCQSCANDRFVNTYRLGWEKVIEECSTKYEGIYDYYLEDQVKYVGNRTKTAVHCKEHGIFTVSVHDHKNGNVGCQKCNNSYGEDTIGRYLDNHFINYIPQYKNVNCRGDSKVLKFDFYLPNYNIMIEYDGPQHHEYYPEWFHNKGYWEFELQQKYDEVKNNFCIDNNIHLIRIRYDVENIESYLKDELYNIIHS